MDGRRARARAAPVHVTALLLALLGVPVLARALNVPPAPEAQRAALPPSGTNLYTPPLPALALDPRYNGDTSPTLSPTTCVVTQVTHPPDHVCGDAGDASALPQHHTSYTHSHARARTGGFTRPSGFFEPAASVHSHGRCTTHVGAAVAAQQLCLPPTRSPSALMSGGRGLGQDCGAASFCASEYRCVQCAHCCRGTIPANDGATAPLSSPCSGSGGCCVRWADEGGAGLSHGEVVRERDCGSSELAAGD
jgi:hypothetical protein